MLEIKKHRQVMFEVISDIYKSKRGRSLGFKGGTMAYFLNGLDRFSVDLDFDLIDPAMEKEIFEVLPKILLKHGRIKEGTNKELTLFYLLNYEPGQTNIKVEISKRVLKSMEYEWRNFYGISVKALKMEHSFAGKLLACVNRKRQANRDFYDVNFYLKKGIRPDEEVIAEATRMTVVKYFKVVRKHVEKNLTERDILRGMGELVDERQKIWIKNNLKRELLGRLDFVIDEMESLQ